MAEKPLKYTKPTIIDLREDQAATGQCYAGSGDLGPCSSGNKAGSCIQGPQASFPCSQGTQAGWGCNSGNNASVACVPGTNGMSWCSRGIGR